MSGAVIVIEVSAPKVSDDALSVLVASCNRAAREAECVLGKNASDEPPSAVAIVSLQSDDRMRVEVGVRQGDHDSWRTKDFAFLAADEAMDRWRAVGFAIGTLAESDAAALSPEAPPPALAEPKPVASAPPPPDKPLSRKPKESPRSLLFVGAEGLVGPGLDSGPWRLGSALGAELGRRGSPLYFTLGGSATTRIARDSSGAAARWYDVSVGGGLSVLGPLQHSGLNLGVKLLVEHFDVSAVSFDARSEGRGRWLFGVEGGLGGRLEVVSDLFLTADLLVDGLSAATDVSVAGTPIGTAESFRYLGSFGLRVRLR